MEKYRGHYQNDILSLLKEQQEILDMASEEIRFLVEKYSDLLDRYQTASRALVRLMNELLFTWDD